MRLINADKLIQGFEENKTFDFERDEYTEGINTGIRWCTEDVDSAPTVNAIPIEWIKNWVETGGDEPVDDFTDVDVYCDGYQKNVIECLLRAWEKEND